MDNKKIMIRYSRHIQNLLPKRIEFENIEFNCGDSNVSIDQIKQNFSIFLINYLKKCLHEEIKELPEFCHVSSIIVDIDNKKKIVDKIGLLNINSLNILQSVYVSIRSRLIYHLLKEKAKLIGYAI